jgi:crotonobetainyl-CoA:carnitine CoA-transferase CaiB-like acyl-CoA transferase
VPGKELPLRDATLLAGVRVLDLTRLFAGPIAGQILGDFGAEVIHVERAGDGDVLRLSEPCLQDAQGKRLPESAGYLSGNRNKKGITVDLATAEGRDIVLQLASRSDVLLENYKVGDLTKRGLDYGSVAAVNPGIIYCSVTGFGQTGPDRFRPGTDPIFQSRGGWMSVTGYPDGAPGGAPMKTGIHVIDTFGGCYAALGVLAALRWRDRNGGAGQHIELALLDTAVATASHAAMAYLVNGQQTPRVGSRVAGACPGGLFECADGYMVAMPGGPQQVRRFFELLDCAEWLADPRFADNTARVRNRDALEPALLQRTRTRSRTALIEALVAAEVPAGPVNDFEQVFEDPQIRARGMVVEAVHPTAGRVSLLANPLKFSRTPITRYAAPPTLGQHTDEVLRDVLEFDASRIERLRARRVI